jgi:hypothetical protein
MVACSKPLPNRTFVVDFEQEFQGGPILTMNGTAGHRVRVTGGELYNHLAPSETADATAVTHTWGYEYIWTMRDGMQTIQQHNFMTFRYLSLQFLDAEPPIDLKVSAWGVAYEWNPKDTAFTSSSPTLNKVWELCENTLRYGVVDTHGYLPSPSANSP